MICSLQSDCATSAMQVLRPFYCEHNNSFHAMVSLTFSNASFGSVCEIHLVSVRSVVKEYPYSFGTYSSRSMTSRSS